jgi:NDP-sugar pyrophosphorylase family protein
MNIINKQPISSLGFGFIDKAYIPKGKDEYYLRNKQHRSSTKYRKLTAKEIQTLVKNDNSADDWNNLEIADEFDARLVKRCSFFGKNRIGKLQPYFHEFNNLRMPVGLYNSTIISCDIGDNVVIDQLSFISHYIIGNDVMLVNIKELASTDHAKFGNGVVKQGEDESVRIWMEICNENGGRKVLPFNGMLPGDAWLWSKYRADKKLLERLKTFTDDKFDRKRGYYGKIGDRTVIKNCDIIKDAWIGSDAYIKGANKLKNITILSSEDAPSQIGEGCELVNGIVGYGCRVFYGVKAVRFLMGTNAQLKYGARLINSYLGDNSTISCCEVLNALIFPGHEQHHNNSFLCAATLQGQSNMAAGATIGSNHNSRAADGELVAGRGFWPGLCVSLKHNSRFSSFSLLAKGDFPAELNIPLPFSLVSNNPHKNELTVMPGYWFEYNFYALARNSEKYALRDKRTDRSIVLEYDYLAPDTINEMMEGLQIMRELIGKAYATKEKKKLTPHQSKVQGEWLLQKNPSYVDSLDIFVVGWENDHRPVRVVKIRQACENFYRLIIAYVFRLLLNEASLPKNGRQKLITLLQKAEGKRTSWKNVGGQLVKAKSLQQLLNAIRQQKINSWDEIHDWYRQQSSRYAQDKLQHALTTLLELLECSAKQCTPTKLASLSEEALQTEWWIHQQIVASRTKDYQNPFREMVYDSKEEMEEVMGKLEDNPFIEANKLRFQEYSLQQKAFVAMVRPIQK